MYKKRKVYQSITVLTVCVLFSLPLRATSIEVADTIHNSTIWNVDTVKVTSDLYLPPYDTLTIDPGTRVVFQGHYLFTDDGRIIANGTPSDSIVFTINDTTGFSAISTYLGSWEGLNIIQDSYSEFSYCIFEYIKTFHPFNGAVTMVNDNSMSYCTVRNCFSNVAAVKSMDLSHFSYGTITYNYCAGISATNVDHCTITKNNGDGIVLFPSWAYYWQNVYSNEIKNNKGIGIKGDNTKGLQIYYNRISNNMEGMELNLPYPVYIQKNIISDNTPSGAININASSIIAGNLIYDNTYTSSNSSDSIKASINITDNSFLYNNTIADNKGIGAGALSLSDGTSSIYNTIFWNNRGNDSLSQIYFVNTNGSDTLTQTMQYSNIEQSDHSIKISGNIDTITGHNIYANPLFIDHPNGPYQLSPGSPCIDSGKLVDNSFPHSGEYSYLTTDLLDRPITFNNKTDIGAYEFYPDSSYIVGVNSYDTTNLKLCLELYRHIILYPNNASLLLNEWTKNGKLINDNKFLVLDSLSQSDSGTYVFTASSEYSTFSGMLKLSFYHSVDTHKQSGNISVCPGTDTSLFISASGKNLLTCTWVKNNAVLQNARDSILPLPGISSADTGIYYCIVDDGCSRDTSRLIHLSLYRDPHIYIPADTSICPDEMITLSPGKESFSKILWNSTTSKDSLKVNQPGKYYVDVWNTHQCHSSDTITVHQFIPKLVDLGHDTTLCPDQHYRISAGNFNSYLWSDGSDSSSIEVDTNTIIWVKVTDKNHCSSSDTVSVAFNYQLPPSIAYISNDLSDNHYKLVIAPDSEQHALTYEIFRSSGNSWSYLDSINVMKPLTYFTDTSSRPDKNGMSYSVRALNSCLIPSYPSTPQKPVFVNYDLIHQDTLNLSVNAYEGIQAKAYYVFSGNAVGQMNIVDTVLSQGEHTSAELTSLPYDSTFFCVAIKVNDSTFSYSNVYLKPRKNSPPYDILLSDSVIYEGNRPGDTIGHLTAKDTDVQDTHTFELPSGIADNQYFRIQGDELLADTSFNYNIKNSYIVRIRTIDNGPGNLKFEKNFTITILRSPTVNIDHPLTEGIVNVFPNPFHKFTTIQLKDKSAVIQTIRLINVDGKTVLNIININKNRYTLYKSTINPGLYFVIIRTNSATYKKVVIIQ